MLLPLLQLAAPCGGYESGHATSDVAIGTMANAPAVVILEPLGFQPIQGSQSRRSFSAISEARAPPAYPSERGSLPGAEPSTEPQDSPSWDPSGAEGEAQGPVPVQTSSFSPDEAVAGTAMAPTEDDYSVYQDLLWRVAQNLGMQAENISESSHALMDILVASVPL